jgi:predicted ATPase
MIKKVHIESYRCIRSLDLTLEPLTALVGPNGSGKSAILSMLDPKMGVGTDDLWQRKPGQSAWKRYEFGDGRVAEARQVHGNLSLESPLDQVACVLLRLDPGLLRQPNSLQLAKRLETSGGNLANVFGSLTRSQQADLAKQLCSLVPLFQDVDVQPLVLGQHMLRFQDRWNSDLWYSPAQVSDGTMLLTAFLTLQFQDPPVTLLAIEEPERGLHPYLLEQLVAFLRKLARGEIGKGPIQVVLATHSPELLEYLEPPEVRFVERDPDDGSTVVKSIPAADPDWPRYFDEYRRSLREAWLSGGLGGVPGA